MVMTMKNVTAVALALGLLSVVAVSSQQPTTPAAAGAKDPSWAFPVKNGDLTPEPEGPKQIPGSTKSYTTKEIDDLSNAVDWFPNDHPPAPSIVMKGHGDARGTQRRIHQASDGGLQERRAQRAEPHEQDRPGALRRGDHPGSGVVREAAAGCRLDEDRGSRNGAEDLRRRRADAVRPAGW